MCKLVTDRSRAMRGFRYCKAVGAMSVLLGLATAAHAADIAWTGGDDGTTLNKGENWSGGSAPGSTDMAKFERNGTLNLTANADFSAGKASFAPKDGPLTVNLDLGGHIWEGNAPASVWNYRFVVGGTETWPIVFNFTDGLITNMTEMSIGNLYAGYAGGSYNTTVNISGSGTRLVSHTADLEVGKGTNNVLEVSNGAYVRTGRALVVGSVASATGNLVRVTGAGTTLVHRPGNDYTYIGKGGSGNRVVVDDGAQFRQESAVVTFTKVGNGATAVGNRFDVSGEAVADFGIWGNLLVGSTGADGNVFTASNATVAARNLYVGYDVSSQDGPCRNAAYLGDGASLAVSNNISVGECKFANSNLVVIAGAGTTARTVNNDVTVGKCGVGNQMSVKDGASLSVSRDLYVGGATSASDDPARDSLLEISGENSRLDVGQYAYVGLVGATNSTLVARDGAKVVANWTIYCGQAADSCYGLIRATGEGTVISNRLYHLQMKGHHNGVSIENGARMQIADQLNIDGTTNYLRIANGEFVNKTANTLKIGTGSRLIWEGSESRCELCSITMTQDGEFDFIADENGLADFGVKYETYLLNNDWTPSVARITVDARRYLKNNKSGTFTILKSNHDRTMRTLDKTEFSQQTAETKAAVTQAFRDRIAFLPEGCGEITEIDLSKSLIKVKVTKHEGFILVFR